MIVCFVAMMYTPLINCLFFLCKKVITTYKKLIEAEGFSLELTISRQF